MRLVKISGGFLEIEETSDQPILPVPPTEPPVVQPPLIPVEPPVAPPARVPYFDIGEATGKPGDIVDIVVEAGCIHPMTGFHIGGGVGKTETEPGYGKFKALGVILGPYLTRYLKAQDAQDAQDAQGPGYAQLHTSPDEVGDHYFSIFQFFDAPGSPLPEQWWEFALQFFSMGHETTFPPIPIPAGTHLFTLQIEILPTTPPGVYELTCKDEWYYLNSRIRRRDFAYTGLGQGFTAIETFGGKITVVP